MVMLQVTGDAEVFVATNGRVPDLTWPVEDSKPFFASVPALMRLLQVDHKPGANFPFDFYTTTPNGAPGTFIDVHSQTSQGLAMRNNDKVYVAMRIPSRLVFSPPLPTTPVLARSKLSVRVVLIDSHGRELAIPAGSRVTLSTTPLECLASHNMTMVIPHDTPLTQLPTHLIFGSVAIACVARPNQQVVLMGSITGPGIGPGVQRAEGTLAMTTDSKDAHNPTMTTALMAPTITPPGGTYPYGICVMMGESQDADPSDLIVFTADGTDPATSGVRYIGPFYMNACGPVTIKCIRASGNNQVCSPVSRVDFYLTPSKPILYGDSNLGPKGEVTLSVGDKPPREGPIEVRYTVDNTIPTPHSALYSAPVRYSEIASGVLKACCVWVPTTIQRRAGVVHALSEPVTLSLFGDGARGVPTNPSDIPYSPYKEPPCPMPVPSTYRPEASLGRGMAGPTPAWGMQRITRTGVSHETSRARLEQLIGMICSVKMNSATALDAKKKSAAALSLGVSPPRSHKNSDSPRPEYYHSPGGNNVYAFNTSHQKGLNRSLGQGYQPQGQQAALGSPASPMPRFHRWVSELHPM